MVVSSQHRLRTSRGTAGIRAGADGGQIGLLGQWREAGGDVTEGPLGTASTCGLEQDAALWLWSQGQEQGKINVDTHFFKWKHIDYQ